MKRPFTNIDCAQLDNLLATNDALLLDCRKLQDYRAAHLNNALHVHEGLVESLLENGDREQLLAIYCYHGHTSQHLAEAFGNAGFTQVYSLAGGYEAWQARKTSA